MLLYGFQRSFIGKNIGTISLRQCILSVNRPPTAVWCAAKVNFQHDRTRVVIVEKMILHSKGGKNEIIVCEMSARSNIDF